MSSRSQRRKERHTRKRQEKKKRLQQSQRRQPEISRRTAVAVGSNARHRERLAQQIPRAWAGEPPFDVAVFDDSVLAALPPELARQVSIVRSSLQAALESRGEDALSQTAVISRGSPLSEWRLFIRGLVGWMANDVEAANEAWKRLSSERRPGRIATAMALALRSDLEQIPRGGTYEPPAVAAPERPESPPDDLLIYHARLLRRVRIDRPVLSVAEAGLKIPEESASLLIGPRKMEWLLQFVKEYGDTEPELAAALSQAALHRAYGQKYVDLFDVAASLFSGPPHDRRNKLLTFHYYRSFDDKVVAGSKAEKALDDYLKNDLPKNEEIPRSLRSAIASHIHLNLAMILMLPEDRNTIMDFLYGPAEDTAGIRRHLKAAVKAAPGNQLAHMACVGWLKGKLDDDNLKERQRSSLEDELANAMQNWSDGCPEDTEPRLWLVDYLLENEKLDEARPHVEYLAASRQENPRVRATPWKWQVLEAMRLSRRKTWLSDVSARLEEADSLWPGWLPKQWLPYLRAAFALRSGDTESFERQRQLICETSGLARDSLADACMMLGAAQRMRVPPDGLKPLRASLDQVLGRIEALPTEDLIEAGSFFWDLHRVKLLYPAYRLHAAKIGKEFLARLLNSDRLVHDRVSDERVQKSVLWASQYRFWSNSYETRQLPLFENPETRQHPLFAAARLNAFLRQRYRWGVEKYGALGSMLREAARTERDAYYRHWFSALADDLDEVVQDNMTSRFGRLFGNSFGGLDEDDEDEDDDDELDSDELDENPECDCEVCRAARGAVEEARYPGESIPF